MQKKQIVVGLSLALSLAIAGLVINYWPNIKGLAPALIEQNQKIEESFDNHGQAINNTNFPLVVPENFSVSIYANRLSGARMLAQDNTGNLWISRSSAGMITKLTENADGTVAAQDVFKNLRNPHGIAFDYRDNTAIYIAEENEISRAPITGGTLQKIADLPTGGGHSTRTIKFGPDGRLYVSSGSSCNVCVESDERRAAIYSLNADGSDFKQVASGLRNSVFFTWSDVDGRMWATDMGRDLLGDNLPPEEINIIESGKFYGWPYCYGNNVHDDNFDKNSSRDCFNAAAPQVEMPAHSAPLGLDFVPEEGWPEEMWHNLIVAFHGSWNSTKPTGYKLVRIKLNAEGKYLGTEDFISGWLAGSGGALGRPVDVFIRPGGIMFVSDDKAGVIYKINYMQ